MTVEDEAVVTHEAITCEGEVYRVHPAASEFDLLGDEEMADLAADIAKRGLKHPIVRLPDGLIIDGRNRLHACRMADVTPRFETYTGDDPVGEIIANNLRRRHLNEDERAVMAVRMLPHIEEQADKGGRPRKIEPTLQLVGDDQKPSAELHEVSVDRPNQRRSTAKAARDFKVAPRRVAQMKRIVENAPGCCRRPWSAPDIFTRPRSLLTRTSTPRRTDATGRSSWSSRGR